MPPNRAGKKDALEVTAFLYKVVKLVAV